MPLYPLLPIASVGFCFYLIWGLPADTFLLFALWMTGGAILYFGYSIRRSHLRVR